MSTRTTTLIVLFITVIAAITGCSKQSNTSSISNNEPVTHPEWSHNAVIYQINPRQHTAEGTFTALLPDLPRLQQLGADILWLMPIHPIGTTNRKGSLGSPYSVQDYKAVNPEFGTFDDLKLFVDSAHALGMYVILDWVANHTAWDHAWVQEHPDWYQKDPTGNMMPPHGTDWTDVVALDYNHPDLWTAMQDAMRYWVTDAGIDGYRCDVAGYVPLDFWHQVRTTLDSIKPVWMLAEWASRDMHEHGFDATYGWPIQEKMHQVAHGKASAAALKYLFAEHLNSFPQDAYHLLFVENHDKNAWEGTQFELYGDMLPVAMVITTTAKGIPMIYSGQEAGNTKRLRFFEKDTILWQPHPIGELYADLLALRKATPALWNGEAGGKMWLLFTDHEEEILAYLRVKGNQRVLVLTNVTDQPVSFSLSQTWASGRYREHFTDMLLEIDTSTQLALSPFGYQIWISE